MADKNNQRYSYTAAPSYDYIPALDGLRAISILFVIAAHFGLEKWVPGGFGVTIFFFISGFLISRQLSHGLNITGKVDLGAFYMRRITRLMPALVVMIALSTLIVIAFGGVVTFTQILSALFYAANYYNLYAMYDSHVPGMRHPFVILWSLAIEEHFYIFFPAFLSVLYGRGRTYVWVLAGLLVMALAWRLYLWHICVTGNGFCGLRGAPERLYEGTDTRFDSLLYGVILTAILARADMQVIGRLLTSSVMAFLGLGLLATTFVIHGDHFRETYRYALQGIALCPLIAAVLFNRRFLPARALLSTKPFVLIGRWSYSLYLFHWIGLMTGEGLIYAHSIPAVARLPLAAVLTVVLSLGSYYLVERPMVRWRRRFGSHAVADAPTNG